MQYFFLYLSPIAHLLNEFYYESLIVYFYFGMANQKSKKYLYSTKILFSSLKHILVLEVWLLVFV